MADAAQQAASVRELLLRAQEGDTEAEQLLVEQNLGLVRAVVRRYAGRGTEYDDLFQLGSMGLVKAIKNFDFSYDVRFSTYAVPLIAGEIKRFLRDDGMVKVSRALKELAVKAVAAGERISSRTGREAGVVEIANALGVSAEDVAAALDANRPALSLNECVGEDEGATRMDFLADGASESGTVNRILAQELLRGLDVAERRLIVLRYFEDKTQTEIAGLMGVSQVQVSRLESRIIKKLRLMAESGTAEKPQRHQSGRSTSSNTE